MKTLQALTIISLFALSEFAHGQSAEWIARKTGNSVAFTRKALASGMVYDPTDNSLTTPDSVGKRIPKRTKSHYIYTYPGPDDVYRLVDQNGEIHWVRGYGNRYDPVTKRYWFRTAKGHWIQIGGPQ
jgi:hypothetical protein